METKTYHLQFYQSEPDDLGIDDWPLMEGQDYEALAERMLLGYVNNKAISPSQCPHYVRLVTNEDVSAIFTLKAVSAEVVEKVPNA